MEKHTPNNYYDILKENIETEKDIYFIEEDLELDEMIATNQVNSKHSGETRDIFTHEGRTYQTYSFNSDSDANNFLKSNKGYGIIGRNGYKVHVCKKVAKGRPLNTTKNKQKDDGTLKEDVLNESKEYELSKGEAKQIRKLGKQLSDLSKDFEFTIEGDIYNVSFGDLKNELNKILKVLRDEL